MARHDATGRRTDRSSDLLFIPPLESVVLPAHFVKTGDARHLGIVLSAQSNE